MIKIVIEMTHKSNLTDEPCLRLIIFEASGLPELQERQWWHVQNIIEYDTRAYNLFEAKIGELIANNAPGSEGQIDMISLCDDDGAVFELNTMRGNIGPYVYPTLKAAFTTWIGQIDPCAAVGEAA